MKRKSLALVFFVSAILAFAVPPELAVEALFDGRYNNNKNVEYSIIKQRGRYSMVMNVKNDVKVLEEASEAIEKDLAKTDDYTSIQNKEGKIIRLKIPNNGEIISVGMKTEENGDFFLYIRGPKKAFQ